MKKHYDFLVVGCGLFGATFAERASALGKSVLIIDKRNHIGGNVYTKEIEDINVHVYGAHIFHTSDESVWEYVNRFASFNNFVHEVIAVYKTERYHLPFNMYTFNELWGVKTAIEAKNKIEEQIKIANIKEIKNLEDQAISLVGTDVYKKLIKGYTEKQWGRECKELPSFIIKRLPLRFEYNNNYFNDKYQGIPIGGYTKMISKMIKNCDLLLGISFEEFNKNYSIKFDNIVYTGMIDEFFNYSLGRLEYRTVRFENKLLNKESYQGSAVVNYTDRKVPYTRIIEHKFFDFHNQKKTYISIEFPKEFQDGDEPFYPINNDKNIGLYDKYIKESQRYKNVYFKGRLGEYKYYDMDDTIKEALTFSKNILN